VRLYSEAPTRIQRNCSRRCATQVGGTLLGALGLAAEAPDVSRGPTAKDDGGGYSMFISAPFNVKHNIHVQVDPSAPTGFTGLPREWDAMLSVSGISKAEVTAHPQEVLSALQFHMEGPPPKCVPLELQRCHSEWCASSSTLCPPFLLKASDAQVV
jgi:hypothetical protein